MAVGGLDALKDTGSECTCPPGSFGRVMDMHKHDCPARWKNDEQLTIKE